MKRNCILSPQEPWVSPWLFSFSWEQRRLGEIATETHGGGTPKTSCCEFWNGSIPWIQSSDLQEDNVENVCPRKKISKAGLHKSATQLVPANSIAIVTRVGVGKVALMSSEYATSQDFLSLSKLTIVPHFGVYAVYQKLQQEIQSVQGTSIKGMTKEYALGLLIAIPTKATEQQRIGAFFRSLDRLITLHHRKHFYVFPKSGVFHNEKTNAWEQRKLSDYLETSTEKNTECAFTIDDVLSVSGDFGVVNQIEFQGRSFAGASVANYGILHVGDVVYTKSPLKASPYGIIKTNKGKTGIVSVLYGVYHPKENLHADIVQTYFEQNARLNNYLRPLVNKGAKNTLLISDDDALQGNVFFPPQKIEQEKIGTFFRSLDDLITLHQRKPLFLFSEELRC